SSSQADAAYRSSATSSRRRVGGKQRRQDARVQAPVTARPCHHQEMTDYRDAGRPATEAIDALSTEIEADLDETAGGISWWNGHVGWMVSAQLGEYLLASCTGVGTSLRNASLAVEEHRRTEFSLN